MDMLYRYKDAFSLRDETGTCPNIEVEIDVTDCIILYHVKEDKIIIDKEMKRLCYLCISKEGFFSIFKSSYVNQQKYQDKKSSNRFQVFKHKNSQV